MSSIDTPAFDTASRPQDSGGDTFRFVYGAIVDHWFVLMVGTLIGAILVGVASWWFMEPPRQTWQASSAIILKPSEWQSGLLRDIGSSPLQAITATDLIQRTSPTQIARSVVRSLVQLDVADGGPYSGLATDEEVKQKADEVMGKISFVTTENKWKIQVVVQNADTPEEATRLAEFASRAFIEKNRQLRLGEVEAQHRFVQDELEELRQRLFQAETAEWEYKRREGFRDFADLDQDMARMYNELNELEITRDEIHARLEEAEAQLAKNTETLPQSLNNVTEGAVNKLFDRLDVQLQEQLAMSAVYQPGFPALIEIEEEIAETQQAIVEALRQLDAEEAGGSTAWKQRQDIYRSRVDLRMQLTSSEIRIAALNRMLEEVIPRIPELANKKLELTQYEQETRLLRERFSKLSQSEWDIKTALDQGGGQLHRDESVSQASVVLLGGSGTSLGINTLLGALIGFVFAFGGVMLQEMNDTSIRSIDDVTQYIGLEVLGTIPRMRFGSPRALDNRRRRATYVSTTDEEQTDACIVTQHDPKSPISEAYRTLRTNFQFATITQQPKSVMVTSAVPGEGKTTTAVNMAVTMADRGMRVLIVDTDLRRPNVHRVLRMERGPGLSDVLRSGDDISTVIRATRVNGLSIISSGRVPPNPSELIGSERMAKIMEELGTKFDLVICDAPSVLVVTDPVLLATHVDTSVMVVSTRNVRRETVIRAKKLLETANGDIAGVVVNGLETGRRHYYYYYYYYDDRSRGRRKWYHNI